MKPNETAKPVYPAYLTVRLDESLREALAKLAYEHERSVSSEARVAIIRYLEDHAQGDSG